MALIPFYMGKIKGCIDLCTMKRCHFWYRQQEYCGRYFCRWCKKLVEKGSLGVRITYPMSNRIWEKDKPASIVFHSDCYLEQLKLYLNYWAEKHPPKPRRKIGRPTIPCSDRPRRRRLLSLLIHHRKLGHTARVEELQKEIEELSTSLTTRLL